jgi:cyclase
VQAEDRYEKALPKAAWPTQSFYTGGTLDAGGEHVEYGYLLEAHTAGDIYVYFRDANVLVVGDAVSPARDPELDWYAGGWLGGRVDALELLLKISNDATRIVPGFGPVIGRKELQAEHDLMLALFTRTAELMRKGYRTQDMLEAGILRDSGRSWADPQKFMNDAHKGMWAHHNTLSHDIV